MPKFAFQQDIKVSMWQRQYFVIDAKTEAEAKNIAMQFIDKDVSSSEYFDFAEDMLNTQELIQVSPAHPGSTIQLFMYGETTPFAENGATRTDDTQSIIHNNLMEQVNNWLQQGTDCKTVVMADTTYYICHVQGRLCVVAVKGQTEAARYLFVESWEDIVSHNDIFKQEMFEYILRKKIKEGQERDVVKWIVGRNKELEDVPFNMEDFITVWSHRAAKQIFEPTVLLGYKIADEQGNVPDGFFPSQVIKDIHKAEKLLTVVRQKEPVHKGMFIFPVYAGDITNPTFI